MNVLKPKILLYTDCDFFAGCEKPLENICRFPSISDQYDIVYAYRKSRRYSNDIKGKMLPVRLCPIFLITPSLFLRQAEKRGKVIELVAKAFVRLLKIFQIFNLLYLCRQMLLITKEKPDIVHVNNGGYPGADSCRIMAITAPFLGVKKIVFTINNMAVPTNNFLERCLDRRVDVGVDYFVTASKAASNELIKVRSIGNGKVQAIPNAVLFDGLGCNKSNSFKEEFEIAQNSLLIGSTGLLIERKGYDVLIEAANLLNKDKDWHIFIFGEGDQRSRLESLVKKYELQNRVFMPGFKNNILDYVQAFDVFVLPTTGSEDMPNCINEAMLLRKPIIGTRTSGIPEQINDNENGYLVVPGDVDDLTFKLNQIVDLDKEQLAAMGESSYEKYMSSFSYRIAMEKYKSIYRANSNLSNLKN